MRDQDSQNIRRHQNRTNDIKVRGEDENGKKKEMPNYVPSGALNKILKNGIVMKYSEPSDKAVPTSPKRLYIYKNDELLQSLKLSNSSYLIGSDGNVVDIKVSHPSVSKQHACLQYRAVKGVLNLYIIDLESSNGSRCNDQAIDSSRYYQVLDNDVLKFASSSREFVVIGETTT